MKKTFPHLNFELELWNQGFLVAGIDEVGRGSFAGPLVVGAVVLKPAITKKDSDWLLSLGINDSKLVTPQKRKLLNKIAQELVLFSTVQYIQVPTINEQGIGDANKLGFEQVAGRINGQPRINNVFFLTDAFEIPKVRKDRQKNIIHGDATSISIALASIIAKVERDNFMEKLSEEFPSYGFEKHKGYGTKLHREKIKEYGPCPYHRTQFISSYI